MKTFEYVKITLKNMLTNFQVSILYFIGLPLIIGAAMGFMNETMHGAKDVKIDPIKIVIQDEDNSKTSKVFSDFLRSDLMKESLKVVEDDFDATVVIPKGYEESVLSSTKSTIKIKENNTAISKLQIVSGIVDSYHIELFKGMNREEFKTDFDVVKLEQKQVESPYSFYSVSMIGLVFSMIILGLINSAVDKKYKCMNDRVQSTPNSRVKILNMKALSYFIYSALSIFIYCMVYRAGGTAFTGEMLPLVFVIGITSIVITSIVIFVSTIFGEKYSKVVAMIIFMLPIVGGGVFFEGTNILSNISPSYYITELFTIYERVGSVEGKLSTVGVMIIASAILYGITIIKETGRRKKNEATMVNMG
ncbi:MAG: ABC transporter permease [Clostridium sp.]